MIAATLMALGLAMTSPSPRPEPVEGQHPQPAAVPDDYAYQLFLPRGYLIEHRRAVPTSTTKTDIKKDKK
ncbi:hypothetical protein G4G27_23240 [Sphingomonas sp. So64.6b]|uniref:hypothetical protein n=1 Tax=Sphingomonas sp. So64.6b TaxID=2997354 RepID=UPI0015FFE34A|nr:hypothetical protein [Sphingomonas sp. So64.6b]QNA86568.1 hypothetical protein G4G27_23240 [Sphingomonas sp. So64.6b]